MEKLMRIIRSGLILAALTVLTFASCKQPVLYQVGPPQEIIYIDGGTLTASYLPSRLSLYDVEINYWDTEGEFIDFQYFESIPSAGPTTIDLCMPENCDSFSAFVIDPGTGMPLFFEQLYDTVPEESYSIEWWLDYRKYFFTTPSQEEYGVSLERAVPMPMNGSLTIPQGSSHYTLLVAQNPAGDHLYRRIEYVTNGPQVIRSFETDRDRLLGSHTKASRTEEALESFSDQVYLMLSFSELDDVVIEAKFTSVPFVRMDDPPRCIVATSDPEIMYGYGNGDIYRIETVKQSADIIGQIAADGVRGAAWSESRQSIVLREAFWGGRLIEYSVLTGAMRIIYRATPDNELAEMAMNTRGDRLYVAIDGSSGISFHIFDMETMEILSSRFFSAQAYSGRFLLDEQGQQMLCERLGEIHTLSVADDVIHQPQIYFGEISGFEAEPICVDSPGQNLLIFNNDDDEYQSYSLTDMSPSGGRLSTKSTLALRSAVYLSDSSQLMMAFHDWGSAISYLAVLDSDGLTEIDRVPIPAPASALGRATNAGEGMYVFSANDSMEGRGLYFARLP